MSAPILHSEQQLFASDRFRLVDEHWSTRDGVMHRPVIHHPGAVGILAQPSPQTLVLVRQFRYPIRRWTLEIPAGTRSPNETADATARRELAEETGWRCERVDELMRVFPAIGVSDEELVLFRAQGLSQGMPSPEAGELVTGELVQVGELAGLVAQGLISDAKTLLVLALLGLPLLPSQPASAPSRWREA